jgi:hypothetical protein
VLAPAIRMIDPSAVFPVMTAPRLRRGQAPAGIHGLSSSQQRKAWIPPFAGMTGGTVGGSIFTAAGTYTIKHHARLRVRLSAGEVGGRQPGGARPSGLSGKSPDG